MIIDFHTHIFPEKIAAKTIEKLQDVSGIKAAADGTLNGLIKYMEQAGIDCSVIMPVCTRPEQFETVNQFAAEINENYEGKVLSFGGIHPENENVKDKLKQIKSMGIPGIKLHPDYQKVMIDDIRYMRIIEYASEMGLIILTHAGIDIGLPEPIHCPPDKMRKVLDAIKPEKMVLAHYGGWKQWDMVYDLLAGENVYLDTAFLFDYIEQDMFLKILEKHDPEKILFATDSPWSDAVKGINYVKNLPVCEEVKAMILGENALGLLETI